MSNREIAGRLFISERTAEYHVEQLRNKLGVHSRSDVADALGADVQRGERAAPRLPIELTSFVGRRQELDEVRRLLTRNRLVTVAGSPGIGKTRLAREVAREASWAFPGGVFLVELATVSDPGGVLGAVAAAVGARDAEGITGRLPTQPCLLLVDNCENVVDAAAEAVETVLQAGPAVRVLTTSRVPLRAGGEVVYRLAGLREAEQLFCERAVQAAPEFTPTATVATVCKRLEGIPLAIELAAARAGVMSVEEIDRALDESLALLSGGRRTANPRQQSLRAAIQSSFDLLTDSEQRMFARLAVFAGSFTMAAATDVCGDGVPDAAAVFVDLVDKSLVVATSPPGEPSRYHLLEAIRQFAAAVLGEGAEAERTRARHFEHYQRLVAVGAGDRIRRPDRAYINLVGQEMPNLRAALAWGQRRLPGECVEMLTHVFWYWDHRGPATEAAALISAALATGAGADEARAQLLWVAGILAIRRGDLAAARLHHDEGIELYRRLGDWGQLARMLNNLAVIVEADEAAALLVEADGCASRSGDPSVRALVTTSLAERHRRDGDLAAARAGLEAGLALRREAGHEWGVARSLLSLAHLAIDEGRQHDWPGLLAEALAIVVDLDDQPGIASVLYAHARGTADPRLALRLAGRAHELRRRTGESGLLLDRQPDVEERLSAARAELSDEAATIEKAGAAMTLEEARVEALGVG